MGNGVEFPGANRRYAPPEGVSEEQCKTLHVFTNGKCLVSCWEFTDEEIAEIVRTRRAFVSVWSGGTLFPIFVGSESVTRGVVADFGAVWKSEPAERLVSQGRHSEGPWTAEGPDEFGDYNIHEPSIRAVVAAVISNLRTPSEIRANARLIGAAPDLLAACKKAAEWLAGWASAEPYLSHLHATIAKAEAQELEKK